MNALPYYSATTAVFAVHHRMAERVAASRTGISLISPLPVNVDLAAAMPLAGWVAQASMYKDFAAVRPDYSGVGFALVSYYPQLAKMAPAAAAREVYAAWSEWWQTGAKFFEREQNTIHALAYRIADGSIDDVAEEIATIESYRKAGHVIFATRVPYADPGCRGRWAMCGAASESKYTGGPAVVSDVANAELKKALACYPSADRESKIAQWRDFAVGFVSDESTFIEKAVSVARSQRLLGPAATGTGQ